jgi:hypothetical protein
MWVALTDGWRSILVPPATGSSPGAAPMTWPATNNAISDQSTRRTSTARTPMDIPSALGPRAGVWFHSRGRHARRD